MSDYPEPGKPTAPSCPDDGTCHHGCPSVAACFRVAWCGPFTGTYPGDAWPGDMSAEARRARGAAMLSGATPLTIEDVIPRAAGAGVPVTDDPCTCPAIGMSCPHCGRPLGQSHRDRCHKAAVGNLNVTPAGSRKPEADHA